MRYTIHPDVFQRFPGYVRGVVVLRVERNPVDPIPEVEALLRAAEEAVRARTDLDPLPEHPRIAAWRQALAALGARPPSKYPASVEALLKRARKGRPLPYINTLTALCNAASLRFLLPVGGHDVGQAVGELWLRPAEGTEIFRPLGSEAVEHPQPGEFIYVDDREVLTRRWVWRQGVHTLMGPESRFVAINVDGLPPATREEVEAACRWLLEVVPAHCGGRGGWALLSAETPSLDLEAVAAGG